jgi:hypothetical protein
MTPGQALKHPWMKETSPEYMFPCPGNTAKNGKKNKKGIKYFWMDLEYYYFI